MSSPNLGSISWVDLTVPDCEGVRAFYERVVGWTPHPVDMEGYSDYCMMPPGADRPAAGICHARGVNADIPPHWLIYITVRDVDASVQACRTLGGTVIREPGDMGGAKVAIIRDPAGAICALYEPPKSQNLTPETHGGG